MATQQAQPHRNDPHEGSIEMLSAATLGHETQQTSEICCFALDFGWREELFAQSAKGAFTMNEPAGVATDNLYSVPTTKHAML